MKVLLVEDETDTRHSLNTYLSNQDHEVLEADNGLDALRLFYESKPNLVLLGVRLPKLDGWGILEQIRKTSQIPVIMISNLDSRNDATKGLRLGADDYLHKPLDLAELDARIHAIMRRVQTAPQHVTHEVGSIRIDDRSKQVQVNGVQVSLSPREYALLRLLASEPNRVFSWEEIINQVWPKQSKADATDVKQYIHLLRNKVESKHPGEQRLIHTVKGFGYCVRD